MQALWTNRIPAALFSAALVAGCASPRIVTIPATDPARLAGADAVVIEDMARGAPKSPEGVVSGAGEGAAVAMGQWLSGAGGASTGGDPYAGAAILAIMVVGLPIAAMVGAGKAHSTDEVDRAKTTFANVVNEPDLLPSLPQRIAGRVRRDAPARWTCIDVATAETPAPCAQAAAPVRLAVTASYAPSIEGRFDPQISLAALVEAQVTDPTGQTQEMRWRYDTVPRAFFELTGRDGAPLRGEIDAMLDRLAATVARDALTAPIPLDAEVWDSGAPGGFFDPSWVQANAPTRTRPGVVRRMHPQEPTPLALEAPVKAVVVGRGPGFWTPACVIAAIDGAAPPPPQSTVNMQAGKSFVATADPGEHEFTIRCHYGAESQPQKIVATVEAGHVYCTDGSLFTDVTGGKECPD